MTSFTSAGAEEPAAAAVEEVGLPISDCRVCGERVYEGGGGVRRPPSCTGGLERSRKTRKKEEIAQKMGWASNSKAFDGPTNLSFLISVF